MFRKRVTKYEAVNETGEVVGVKYVSPFNLKELKTLGTVTIKVTRDMFEISAEDFVKHATLVVEEEE